jgi:hypothetical protein
MPAMGTVTRKVGFPWLLRRVLLPAALRLLRPAFLVRQAAALERRRVRWGGRGGGGGLVRSREHWRRRAHHPARRQRLHMGVALGPAGPAPLQRSDRWPPGHRWSEPDRVALCSASPATSGWSILSASSSSRRGLLTRRLAGMGRAGCWHAVGRARRRGDPPASTALRRLPLEDRCSRHRRVVPLRGLLAASPPEIGSGASWPSMPKWMPRPRRERGQIGASW